MGVWNNLLDYCTSKPPVIVFFISIMAFALTLAGLAISVELNKGNLLNPDVKSWNLFFRALSSLDVCFHSNEKPQNIQTKTSIDEPNPANKQNITLLSFMTDAVFLVDEDEKFFFYIQGAASVEDLGIEFSVAAMGSPHPSNEIEITVSSVGSPSSKEQVCVTVTGSASFLPNAESPKPYCSHPKPSSVQHVSFLPSWKAETKEFCPSEEHGKLILKEREDLNIYLSEKDVSLIQLRILFISTLLCGTMLVVLLCAFLGRYGKTESHKSQDSIKGKIRSGFKVPLK